MERLANAAWKLLKLGRGVSVDGNDIQTMQSVLEVGCATATIMTYAVNMRDMRGKSWNDPCSQGLRSAQCTTLTEVVGLMMTPSHVGCEMRDHHDIVSADVAQSTSMLEKTCKSLFSKEYYTALLATVMRSVFETPEKSMPGGQPAHDLRLGPLFSPQNTPAGIQSHKIADRITLPDFRKMIRPRQMLGKGWTRLWRLLLDKTARSTMLHACFGAGPGKTVQIRTH
ncbi:hypothetical protein B0H14DRAFT_2615173 [Mycena olivaceomarginata]|nr:hypothetical protein B0H14DRAFT_2615173 [Mycena olivaceomarginata]